MTTQTTEGKPAEAPAPKAAEPAAPAAPAPQVDVAKIQADAVAAATKVAGDKLKQIGKALTGEDDKPPVNQLLEQLLTAPERTLLGLKDLAKKEVKKEIAEERAAVSKIENIQRSVGQEYVNKYPEINSAKKLEVVEAYAATHERAGKSYEEALKLGFEEAVKEFGLQSVDDAQRNGAYRSGLPGGGGMAPGSPKFNEEKSQNDFISGMRAKASSQRTKTQK